MAAWGERLAGVRGVLLDISGVLYDGGEGGGKVIAGSVEAVARLKQSGLKVRFCTNESQRSRKHLVGELHHLGFDISESEVTAPPPAACQILKERGLRPHLLIHDEVRSEFDEIDTSNPNCVVIADAGENFSYQNVNKAFQVLMELQNPVLLSLGMGRYYKITSGLTLDVGSYTKALEYACGIEAEVVGKPSPEFFKSALREMGVEAHQVKNRKALSVQQKHFVGKTTRSRIEKMHERKPRFLPPFHDDCLETDWVLNIHLKKTKSSSDFRVHGAPPPGSPAAGGFLEALVGKPGPGRPCCLFWAGPSVARPVPQGTAWPPCCWT